MSRPAAVPGLSRLIGLVAAGRVVVLSGAGISTDSGIPDYRGPDGAQRHASPMTFDEFRGSEAARRRYWARSFVGWQRVATARPNVAHHAVAELQRAGLLTGIVTQNVDGLHAAAGARDVVDLHGRLDAVRCLDCDDRRPRIEITLRLAAVNPAFAAAVAGGKAAVRPDGDVALPDHLVDRFQVVACRRCGGVLKPDVVFFGEALPRNRFSTALALLDDARSLLVLGSSLAVGSGYRFVTGAAQRGLPVAIVNRGATRADSHATIKIDAGLGEVLPEVRSAILGPAARPSPRPARSVPTGAG